MVLVGASVSVAQADDTKLGQQMDDASRALKSLRTVKTEEEKVQAVRNAQAAILAGISEVPVMFKSAGTSGQELDLALADYRKLMAESYAALCELEIAVIKADDAAIKAAMDKIKALKKDGHTKYEED
ncbi:hypothetical protein [Persicirhabdus sediminis]|nr:hypothetical protein [Persicirhabdus sediminis]